MTEGHRLDDQHGISFQQRHSPAKEQCCISFGSVMTEHPESEDGVLLLDHYVKNDKSRRTGFWSRPRGKLPWMDCIFHSYLENADPNCKAQKVPLILRLSSQRRVTGKSFFDRLDTISFIRRPSSPSFVKISYPLSYRNHHTLN